MEVSVNNPQLKLFIEQKVKSGDYKNPSEVVEDALSLLQRTPRSLDELRALVDPALEQLDRGVHADFDAEKIKREGRKRLAAQKKQAG